MGNCKPTYKGKRYNSLEELYKANGVSAQQALQLYSEYLEQNPNGNIEGFKQWNNRQQQINELFESNPELANEVYEAAGFVPKMISREGQEYFNNPRIRFFVKIADEVRAVLPDVKEGYTRLYRGNRPSDLKSNPQFTNSLEGIALPFLMSYEGQLSYIDVPTPDLSKYVQRGGVATNAEFIVTSEMAKSATPIDNTIVEKYKEQYPDKLAPVEITPQQKQQAQQLYFQYFDSLNKPNTNPILQTNQEEQVKKFAELQERLNNKGFLEGAKNAYENSEGLKSFGTQEEYDDYIARVSLGIIKNPSSGEYNYTSKVKDIVYHGANEPIEGEKFTKREGATGGGIWFSGSRRYAQIQMDRAQPSESLIGRKLRGAPTMYQVVLNTKNPKHFYNATGALLVQTPREFEKQYDRTVNDAALFHHPDSKKPATADSADQIVVFEPEQIHILGSKQDVEGFKAFVESNNTKTNNSELIDKNTESEIKPIVDAENKTIKNNYETFKEVQDFFDSNLSTMDNIYNAIFNNSEITPDDIIKQIIKTDNVEKECNGGVSNSSWEIV